MDVFQASTLHIFSSYAQEDERYCRELEKHLSSLKREKLISGWSEKAIHAGQERDQEIDRHLNTADIILLLTSADFLASDYYNDVILKRAMQRHEQQTARIIPIIVRPCDWKGTPFEKLQVLPTNKKPIIRWSHHDQAYLSIVEGLRLVIQELRGHSAPQNTSLGNALPAIQANTPCVFFSYSHEDRDFVTRLRMDLQAQGISVWMDKEDIQTGTPDWEQALRDAIHSAHAILFIASPSARSSRYVKDELRIAEYYQRPIYPLWVAGNHWIEAAPIGMGSLQYVDARDDLYQTALPAIVQTINQTFKAVTTTPPESRTPVVEPRNPYKGLHAFRLEDAHDFFGRTRLIDQLVQALQQILIPKPQNESGSRLLAVIGASGSGKSSVVMAGLLHQLQQDVFPGSRDWLYLNPIVPGKHPLEALTLSLSNHFPARSLASLSEDLSADSMRGLHLLLLSLLKRSDTKVVLFIDQFEELFTQTSSEQERQHFLDLLMTVMTEPEGPVIVLLTLRADFSDRPLQYPEIGRLIDAHRISIFPLEVSDLREIIEQPAQLPGVQLTFEADLVGDLLFDIRGEPNALPLLQFTLDQLFQRRHGHVLTRQAYKDLGGVRGSLAQHAEATYRSLPLEDHRRLTRALFLRLIDAGTPEQDAIRRRTALSELILTDTHESTVLQEVTNAFTTARLLTTNIITGIPTIEVSHEALISQWARLQNWLGEAYEDIHLQKKLSEDVATWIYLGKPVDRLYRGS